MTLKEHIKECESRYYPTKKDRLYLEDDDYIVGMSYRYDQYLKHTSIFINNIPEIACVEYILKNDEGFLYTTDEDGNKKNKSVFYIEKLKHKKLL